MLIYILFSPAAYMTALITLAYWNHFVQVLYFNSKFESHTLAVVTYCTKVVFSKDWTKHMFWVKWKSWTCLQILDFCNKALMISSYKPFWITGRIWWKCSPNKTVRPPKKKSYSSMSHKVWSNASIPLQCCIGALFQISSYNMPLA